MDFNPSSYLTMLFLFVIGFFMIFYNLIRLRVYRNAESWPFVSGKLLSCRGFELMNGSAGAKTYGISVSYEYKVKGKLYRSERLKLWPGEYSDAQVRDDVIKGLKEPDSLKVYYDPSEPEKSIIITGDGGRRYSYFIWGAIFLLISTYIVLDRFHMFLKWLY